MKNTPSVSTWQELYVCSEVMKAKIFSNDFKRRRKVKQRPLANSLKFALGCRLLLYALFSVFLIKLSGDVEINPGPTSNANQISHNNRATRSKVSNIPGKVSTKVNDSERMHANSNTDVANMFNEYFVSIFSSDSDVAFEHRDRLHNVEFQNITLSEEEVLAVIMNLDHNKAHGPDNILARLLKETSAQIAPSLCSLFNKSLRIGVVPDDWKLANVVPCLQTRRKS
ncbi:Hypothetical predicted protein [Paramuricea clavata]|uniref:Uncharacterized protein n=1 Tax=Paramuricea clavata TaxID=317549 RepID=A0A6S7LE41_PARCT|nr:Hypothetical predicted protein [Paramuricea clavata]